MSSPVLGRAVGVKRCVALAVKADPMQITGAGGAAEGDDLSLIAQSPLDEERRRGNDADLARAAARLRGFVGDVRSLPRG